MIFDLTPLFLTFKLAFVTTLILIILGIPLAYWVTVTASRFKWFVEPLISLPLVLPPTVLGFYLLLFFSPGSPAGHFLETYLHVKVVFTFTGLIIGSVIFSLPFMVNPIKAGLQSFPKSLIETSYSLGKSEGETFFKIILPNIKPSLLTGIVMAFAHTVGEFGVVLMIGGNIPGETRVASMAIFNHVEALQYHQAHVYSVILLGISFLLLFVLNVFNRKDWNVTG